MLQEFFTFSDKTMTIFLRKFSLLKTKTSTRLLLQRYLYFLVFLSSRNICICLVGQINSNVSKTCSRMQCHLVTKGRVAIAVNRLDCAAYELYDWLTYKAMSVGAQNDLGGHQSFARKMTSSCLTNRSFFSVQIAVTSKKKVFTQIGQLFLFRLW